MESDGKSGLSLSLQTSLITAAVVSDLSAPGGGLTLAWGPKQLPAFPIICPNAELVL